VAIGKSSSYGIAIAPLGTEAHRMNAKGVKMKARSALSATQVGITMAPKQTRTPATRKPSPAPRDGRESPDAELCREVLEGVADAVVAFSDSGELIYANSEAERLLHLTPEDSSSLGRIFGGADKFAEYRSKLTDRAPHHLALRTSEGTPLHVVATAARLVSARHNGVILTLRTVAENRGAVDDAETVRLRFAEYLDQADIAAVFADSASLRIIGANQSARKLMACDDSELRCTPIDGIVGPEFAEAARLMIKEVIADGEARLGEWRIVSPSGRDFFGQLHVGLIAMNERRVLQVIVTDVTERRQLEDQVREARDFLQDLIRSSHLAIVTYDVEFLPRSWNPETEKILGLSHDLAVEEARKPGGLLALPADVRQRVEVSLKAESPSPDGTPRTGLDEPIVHERSHREGRTLNVESIFSPIRKAGGEVVGVVEFARDITEKVRLERETTYLRELNRQIVENIPSGIIVYTTDHRFKLVNKAFADMVGVPREYILGRTPRELGMSDESISEIQGCTDEILRTHKSSGAKVHRSHFPSGMRTIRHYAIPLTDASGDIAIILGIYEDITEEETLQLQLIQSDKLAALGQLAAGIAHEIRSPLSSIYNAIYDLNEIVDRTRPEIAEDIDISMEEIARVQAIINNLLDFARTGDDATTAVDVNDMVTRTVRLMNKVLANQHISVEASLTAGDARVRFNDNAMKQTLVNLMTNAMHAMPDGGKLSLATRSYATSGLLELVVEDTGTGIPAEIINNIFNPFFTTKEPGKGTGLGLSVVHSAVTEHGGSIRVRSEPGSGTSFTLVLRLFEATREVPLADLMPPSLPEEEME